ncbi:PrgI family protein [Pseudonocardia sp. TRM90224]|uniref:PrgI family protein n=1 Tax=Pseudonocardia sp. TRM90224 TaxID=2812678 RepID=UPI001E592616|nr:PrgI family protein [Pseudonocardia sp. TRM90224]
MTRPVQIPSDINRPDRIIGPFTARQAALLTALAGGLYLVWTALGTHIATPVFLAAALPVAAFGFTIIVGSRDGLTLDRLVCAAVRHGIAHRIRRPRAHPDHNDSEDQLPGWLAEQTDQSARTYQAAVAGAPGRSLPVRSVGQSDEVVLGGRPVGVVDLGADGVVVIASVSTVPFELSSPAEQDGLVAGFGRYLHSLTGPIQILIRAVPLDLTAHLRALHTQAAALPHPALAQAARAHLAHLAQLAHRGDDAPLLSRQVLLVLREPHRASRGGTSTRAVEQRLVRRLHDAAGLLSPLGITVLPLDGNDARALLIDTCNPDPLPTGDEPATHQPVTSGNHDHDEVHVDARSAVGADRDEQEADDGWGPDPWQGHPPAQPVRAASRWPR